MPELSFHGTSKTAVPAPDQAVPGRAWFCLRTQLKHEKIAAQHLSLMGDVEVFNPRIRFTRRTRIGPMPVTESMFPNYLFARFDWRTAFNRVNYAPGVSCVVGFGERYPIIPDEAIAEIKAALGEEEIRVVEDGPTPGEQVELTGRAFTGLQGIVTRVIPGAQRVSVLMDFLGRQINVEVGMDSIVRTERRRPL